MLATIRNPKSEIRNALIALALATLLCGCGGKPSEDELAALTALHKSDARIQLNKEGRLYRIDFSDQDLNDELLTHAGNCAKLETLVMRGAVYDEATLAHLAGLKSIHHISLKKTSATDVSLAHLSGLKSLQELDLEETKITDAGLEQLAGLKNLEKIYLGGTSISSAAVGKLRKAIPDLKVYGP